MAKRKSRRREERADCRVPWDIRFYQDQEGAIPARDFLQGLSRNARIELRATLDAVAEAPPPQFSGGLRWQAMHGDMGGIYEVRTKGGKQLHRLFCVIERREPGLSNCSIVVLTGMTKPQNTGFSKGEYQEVRALRDAYRASNPRRVAPG